MDTNELQALMNKAESLLTIQQVADMFDVPARVVRKEAKKGHIPGTVQVLGKYGFDPEKVTDWTPPEAGERVVGARREDGRQRYRIYLSPEEFETLKAGGYELNDPRVAAKARRAARKGKAAPQGEEKPGEPVAGEDPFADFGA